MIINGAIGGEGGGEIIIRRKYGMTINNILGDYDADGNYIQPTEEFDFDLTGVKSFSATGMFHSKFRGNRGIRNVYIPDVVTSSLSTIFVDTFYGSSIKEFHCNGNWTGSSAFTNTFTLSDLEVVDMPDLQELSSNTSSTFQNCYHLTTVNLPSVTYINASYLFSDCTALEELKLPTLRFTYIATDILRGCTALKRLLLPQLRGAYRFGDMVLQSTGLEQVDFSSLTATNSNAGATPTFQNAFTNCDKLLRVDFPMLQAYNGSVFGNTTFNRNTSVHFRTDAQAMVRSMPYYANNFGAKELVFDLVGKITLSNGKTYPRLWSSRDGYYTFNDVHAKIDGEDFWLVFDQSYCAFTNKRINLCWTNGTDRYWTTSNTSGTRVYTNNTCSSSYATTKVFSDLTQDAVYVTAVEIGATAINKNDEVVGTITAME